MKSVKLLLLFFTLAGGVCLLRPASAAPAVFDDAGAMYSKSCASCHGADGRGQTAKGKRLGATDLTNANWQGKTSDAKIIRAITKGKGAMPDYEKTYNADQIKALAAFVRGLKQ